MEESIIYDCIIVGAGLSGLKTANLLKNQNLSVLVLEAKDKVGGRTESIEYNDYSWDIGGQWIGPTQYRINELVKECNQCTFPQFEIGKKVLNFNGKRLEYSSLIPPIGIHYAIECQLILWRIDYICKSINLTNLKEWDKSCYYDSINFQQWIDDNIYFENTKKLIQVSIVSVFSVEPNQLSTLFVFCYFKSSGGVLKTMEVKGGAQQDRILNSSHNLSKILSKKLLITNSTSRVKIKLNNQVYKVEQDFSTNIIRIQSKDVTNNEESYYLGKYLVITVPPNIADKIIYQPELPTNRRLLTSSMKMGKVIKFIIFYNDCWWRDLGFSGEIVSTYDDRYPISICYDGSLKDNLKPSIIGFFEGNHAIEWSLKSKDERKLKVIDFIYNSFNNDKRALSPLNYIDKDWISNKWSNGGYGCVINSNQGYYLNSCALRTPVGNIHFAGTETASEWSGYMEGALQSAERVSNEIIPKFIQNYIPPPSFTKKPIIEDDINLGFLSSFIFITLALLFGLYLIYNLFNNHNNK